MREFGLLFLLVVLLMVATFLSGCTSPNNRFEDNISYRALKIGQQHQHH